MSVPSWILHFITRWNHDRNRQIGCESKIYENRLGGVGIKNVKIILIVIAISIIYIVSAATNPETKFIDEEAVEAIENNVSINDTNQLAENPNDTNEKPSGPVSIPLEKPPFID